MGYASLVVTVAIIAGIYSLLAIGMNMHWGDTGLLNFAHAAFFAIGAYTSAILTTTGGEGLLASRVVGFEFPVVVGLVGGRCWLRSPASSSPSRASVWRETTSRW
ncbi:hypothetical protein VB773_14490 [Haloarculaceae archaeon H-GB2-1]|nr:hypothetical protein [Haloarculaceae archaeon H-GB2-1]